MARTKFALALEQKIGQRRLEIVESLAAGACRDYAEYRNQCGYLRGLEDAMALCEEQENKD